MIDIHTHILPALDDGAENIHESIKMAEMAVKDGIKKVIATPHLYRGTENSLDWSVVQETKDLLTGELKKRGIDLEIYLGAEVHLSHDLLEKIQKYRDQLVLNHSAYLLVEFPAEHIFSGIKNVFFNLMTEGIIPIIAHPERNSVLQRDPAVLLELCQMGALCQANSGSLLGLYGSTVRETVHKFLQMNVIHFLASDCHNTRSLPPEISSAVREIQGETSEYAIRALVEENPSAVLENRDIPYLPEPKSLREGRRSLKIKIPSFLPFSSFPRKRESRRHSRGNRNDKN